MTRKAWLEGSDFDLQELAERLRSGDTRVVREGDLYYLTAREIDAAPDDIQANEIAAALIDRINALGRATDPNFQRVKMSGYTDETGRNVVVGTMGATVANVRFRATATVTRPDGTAVPEPPSPWPGRLALAATNPEVAEALKIMDRAEPLGWVELYKIHEIIRDAIKPDKVADRGWTDKATDSAFTGSANLPGVSGSGARHARLAGTPKRTMTIDEGRAYVGNLVTEWLDWLS